MIVSAHVINLAHRVDRKHSVTREMVRMGIIPMIHDAPRVAIDGHLGCALGHFLTVRNVLKERRGRMSSQLIAEDDALFVHDRVTTFALLNEFRATHGDDWDALFLGSFYQGHFDPLTEKFPRPVLMNQATAYILNDRFADEWLTYLHGCISKRMLSPQGLNGILDQEWTPMLLNRKVHCVNPKLIAQADNFSDTEHTFCYGGIGKDLNHAPNQPS